MFYKPLSCFVLLDHINHPKLYNITGPRSSCLQGVVARCIGHGATLDLARGQTFALFPRKQPWEHRHGKAPLGGADSNVVWCVWQKNETHTSRRLGEAAKEKCRKLASSTCKLIDHLSERECKSGRERKVSKTGDDHDARQTSGHPIEIFAPKAKFDL